MEFVKGRVVSVVRTVAGGTLIAAASTSDTTLLLDDVSSFNDDGGTIEVDGTIMDYTAIDHDLNTLTVPALAAGIATDTFVAVSPVAPIHTAYVLADDDVNGDPIPARIPQDKWAMFLEGIREPGLGEAVTLQHDGDEWTVFDVEFQTSYHDASTTPIIITDEDGETARLDADGLTFGTNDIAMFLWEIVGTSFYLAAADGYVYAIDGSSDIRKYDSDGVEVTSGFPIAGTFSRLTVADGFLYARDAANDIRKYDATTGVENTSGFPIAGTFAWLGAADGFVYAIDGSADIRKYDATTGVENTSGFPITGTFSTLAAAGGFVYAIDSADDIRKYDATTGTENTSGFPIAGTFGFVALDGDNLYAEDAVSGNARKFDATTGVEDVTLFPIAGLFGYLAADGGYLYSTDPTDDIRKYSTGATSETSASIEATTGRARFLISEAYSTRMRRTTTFATTTATAATINGYTTNLGTLGNANPFWRFAAGIFTIEQPGLYRLAAFVEWSANSTGLRLATILIDGAVASDYVGVTQVASPSVVTRQACGDTFYLTGGQTVELEVRQDSGGNLNVNKASLSITRVGALAA